MQMNEIVGQIPAVKRLPTADEAPIARRAPQETRVKRPDTRMSRPVTAQPPEVAFEPKRSRRCYGAGF